MNVTPVRNPTFVTLSDGAIRNSYDLRLLNKHGETRQFRLSLTSDAPMVLKLEAQDTLTVAVPANATTMLRAYVTAPAGSHAARQERTDLRLWAEDLGSTDRVHHDTVFNGKDD